MSVSFVYSLISASLDSLSGQLLKRVGAFYLSEAMKINESITSLRYRLICL